jgi:hypothetical protein
MVVSYVPAREEGYRTYQMTEQHTLKQLSAGMETYLERRYRLLGNRRPMAKHCDHCTGSSEVDKEGASDSVTPRWTFRVENWRRKSQQRWSANNLCAFSMAFALETLN